MSFAACRPRMPFGSCLHDELGGDGERRYRKVSLVTPTARLIPT